MSNAYSRDDLLAFLDHAARRGLMPAATAKALGVATRNVLSVLSDEEKADLSQLDLDAIVKRFTNKRARDFNPSSLEEYARRIRRAVELFQSWRRDPANFTVARRSTSAARRKKPDTVPTATSYDHPPGVADEASSSPDTYHSAVPVRPGVVVTLANIPRDLSRAEAERLAAFVRMLAVE